MTRVAAGHRRLHRLRRLQCSPGLVFGVDLQDALVQLGLDAGGEVQPHFVAAEPCTAAFEVSVSRRGGTQPLAGELEPDPGVRVHERNQRVASWRCADASGLPARLRSRLPGEKPGPSKQSCRYGMYGRWIAQ